MYTNLKNYMYNIGVRNVFLIKTANPRQMVKAKSNKQKQGNTHIQKKQKQNKIKQKGREQPEKQENLKTKSNN